MVGGIYACNRSPIPAFIPIALDTQYLVGFYYANLRGVVEQRAHEEFFGPPVRFPTVGSSWVPTIPGTDEKAFELPV